MRGNNNTGAKTHTHKHTHTYADSIYALTQRKTAVITIIIIN